MMKGGFERETPREQGSLHFLLVGSAQSPFGAASRVGALNQSVV
jgi:hypothetical protein